MRMHVKSYQQAADATVQPAPGLQVGLDKTNAQDQMAMFAKTYFNQFQKTRQGMQRSVRLILRCPCQYAGILMPVQCFNQPYLVLMLALHNLQSMHCVLAPLHV